MAASVAFSPDLVELREDDNRDVQALADNQSARLFKEKWRTLHCSPDNSQSTEVTLIAQGSEWLGDAFKRLNSLEALMPNWDSYGAQPPNSLAIALGRTMLNALAATDYQPAHVDASVEGGVCIAFSHDRRYGDIECFNSGEVLAVVTESQGEPSVWKVEATEHGLRQAALRIRAFLGR